MRARIPYTDSSLIRSLRTGRAGGTYDSTLLLACRVYQHRSGRQAIAGRKKRFGATTLVNSVDGNAVQPVLDLTGDEGVNVAIEAWAAGYVQYLRLQPGKLVRTDSQ